MYPVVALSALFVLLLHELARAIFSALAPSRGVLHCTPRRFAMLRKAYNPARESWAHRLSKSGESL
jgi:hypothetical protein